MTTRDLVSEEYQTALNSGLNDEQAFHYVLFLLEFKPELLTERNYYADTLIKRFKDGSIVARSDWQCRQILIETYQMVVEYGGLFGNWYCKQEEI